MRAAVYQEPSRLTIEDVPVPEVGPKDVLVRVGAVGICGSDLHSYKIGAYVEPGQIMGHEWMGVVAKVGDEVEDLAEGERVTGFELGVCGECYWCQRKQYGLCPELFHNSTAYGKPGAFAEYIPIRNAVVGQSIYKIPDHLPDDVAATVEPTSVGLYAVEQGGVKQGDTVVVLGVGMIGNVCVQAAKAAGAKTVVAVDVSPLRLQAAQQVGADHVCDPREGDPIDFVKETIGVGRYHFGEGGMADVVIEAAGVPDTTRQAFEMVRSGGTIVFVALPEEAAPFDVTKLVHKQPRVIGVLGGSLKDAVAALADGRVDTRPLITHSFPLEQASEAFAQQLRGGEAIKVLIKPEGA